MRQLQLVVLFLIGSTTVFGQEQVQFLSEDGLQITADYYKGTTKKLILLFHQAMYSRGAYREIAPKLNAMGYSCLAVDLRSGGTVNGIPNLSCSAAREKGLKTKYINAYQDVKASIAYAQQNYQPTQLLIWGSSYSSSLVLKYGGEYSGEVAAILAFSPGEYFKEKDFIQSTATQIKTPVFITSKAGEQKKWQGIYNAIPDEYRTFFVPKKGGHHGAKALWNKFDDNAIYWEAVTNFLKKIL